MFLLKIMMESAKSWLSGWIMVIVAQKIWIRIYSNLKVTLNHYSLLVSKKICIKICDNVRVTSNIFSSCFNKVPYLATSYLQGNCFGRSKKLQFKTNELGSILISSRGKCVDLGSYPIDAQRIQFEDRI